MTTKTTHMSRVGRPSPQQRAAGRRQRTTTGQFLSGTTTETPATTEPATEPEPAQEPTTEPTERFVGDLPVVEVLPVYTGLPTRAGQPKIALKGTVQLVLSDGTKVFGCADCTFSDPSRGTLMRHRNEDHGQNLGGWHSTRAAKTGTPATGRKAATATAAVLGMTLGEVLAMAEHLEDYALVIEKQEARIEELRERAEAAERRVRKISFQVEKAGLRFAVED